MMPSRAVAVEDLTLGGGSPALPDRYRVLLMLLVIIHLIKIPRFASECLPASSVGDALQVWDLLAYVLLILLP